MRLPTRPISLILILWLAFSPVFAQDWQGLASRSRAGDFPAGGNYAASNAFPKNSLVDIFDPATGKKVRVIVTRELQDPSLLMVLSPEAADSIGLESGRTINIAADVIPLPGTSGQRYVNEPALSNDPDINPAAGMKGNSNALALALAPTPTPGPVVTPTPAPVALATPSTTKAPSPAPSSGARDIGSDNSVLIAGGPTATPGPTPTPGPVAVATPTPGPEASPSTSNNLVKSNSPAPSVSSTVILPQPSSPVKASAGPTTPPRKWVGVQNGIESLKNAPLSQGNLGDIAKTSVLPTPSPLAVVGTPGPNSRGTGIAQGLNTYKTGGSSINPGDVARPDQSLWLRGAAESKVANAMPLPSVAPGVAVKGPEAGQVLRPQSSPAAATAYNLTTPSNPKSKSAILAPVATPAGPVLSDGKGLYDRALDDVRERGSVRSNSVVAQENGRAETSVGLSAAESGSSSAALPGAKLPNQDLPNATGSLKNPGQVGVATNLPEAQLKSNENPTTSLNGPGSPSGAKVNDSLAEAKLPSTNTPESFNPYLESPTPGLVAGNLPEAKIGSRDAAEATHVAPNPNAVAMTTDLPIANPKGSEKAESGMQLQADPPLVTTNLPESKVANAERPERPSPSAFADSVLITIQPADFRPPKVKGAETPEATTNLGPTSSNAVGDLKNPTVKGAEAADASNPSLGPNASAVANDLRNPSVKGAENADSGTNPPGTAVAAVTSALKEPNANPADPSTASRTAQNGTIAVNPNEAKIPGRPDSAPFIPGRTDSAIAGNLRDPNVVGTADASAVAKNPNGTNNLNLVTPGVQNPDSLPSTTAPGTTAKVPNTLADAQPKTTPAPRIVYVPTGGPTPTPGPSTVDPRVQQILQYLEPGAKPPMADGNATTVSLSNQFNEIGWAKDNLPLMNKLQTKQWYVQVGSFQNPHVAGDALRRVAPNYAVGVLPESSGQKGLYKVFVGPLKEDEKGLVLYWFRSKGYRDAFAREGN